MQQRTFIPFFYLFIYFSVRIFYYFFFTFKNAHFKLNNIPFSSPPAAAAAVLDGEGKNFNNKRRRRRATTSVRNNNSDISQEKGEGDEEH